VTDDAGLTGEQLAALQAEVQAIRDAARAALEAHEEAGE
jgi:hypothetical protein